jgi:hypothetical protein
MSTSVGSGEQFPTGRWPDQLSHDPNSAVFRHSVSNDVQIEALDHLQIFLFDQDGGEPYTMTVTLPIIENLPGQGRMYLFYVQRCHMGDQMMFKVVPGSGNLINGDSIQHAFTLDGTKTLFFAVGLNGSYLIHPFSGSEPAPPPPPPGHPPMVTFPLEIPATPSSTVGFPAFTPLPAIAEAWGPSSSAFSPEIVVVSGMEGDFIPNTPVPSITTSGFQATKSGYYWMHANYSMEIHGDSPFTNTGFCYAMVWEFNSAGFFQKEVCRAPAGQSPFFTTPNPPFANIPSYLASPNFDVPFQTTAGYIYTPFICFVHDTPDNLFGASCYGSVSFTKIRDIPPPPPVLLFKNETSSSTDITLSDIEKVYEKVMKETKKRKRN